MNTPASSKINWTSLAVLAVGVSVTAGLIPERWADHAMQAATLIAPILVIIFRTWFTEKN